MKLSIILLIVFSFFSVSERRNSVLDILNSSKKKDFNLETHFNIGIGSIFKPKNENQVRFLEAISQKNYEPAFDLWSTDIQGTAFSRTASGKALYGFLLFQNEFPILGLQQLFDNSQANQIHSSVYYLWNKEINFKHPAWDHFIYSGTQTWDAIRNKDALFKIGSKSLYKNKNKIKYLLSLATFEEFEKFPLEWELVLLTLKDNDMKVTTQILDWLIQKSKPYQKSKAYLTIARLLNDLGEHKAASFYYQKVNNQIPFRIFAQSEEAWIYYNNGDYQQAVARSSSLLYPEFRKKLHPYGFLIVSLSQLKSCDYQGVISSLQLFKNQFHNKYTALKTTSLNTSFTQESLTAYHISKEKVQHPHWPLFIERNIVLKNHLLLLDFIKKNDFNSKKLNFLTKKTISKKIKELETFVDIKIKKIAQKEINQIAKALEWMELVESDALYRIYGFHNLSSESIFKTSQQSMNKKNPNFLYFPYERNELWLDELDQYKSVSNSQCPVKSYVF